MMCKLGGGLLCCDFCPRAFHPRCLKVDEETLPDGDWECPKCKKDMQFSHKEDTLAVRPPKNAANNDPKKMVDFLRALTSHLSLSVDFGYAFREPVDTKMLRDYQRVIEKPISYDEIIAKIDNGFYEEGER
jgi:hypothetical protein